MNAFKVIETNLMHILKIKSFFNEFYLKKVKPIAYLPQTEVLNLAVFRPRPERTEKRNYVTNTT